MDYYRNFDHIDRCHHHPNRVSGLQVKFIDESDYIDPYDIEDFKDFARIDYDTDDALLNTLLKSATTEIERYLQKSLGIRTIRLTAINLPKDYVLPYGPVSEILTDGFTHVGDIMKEGGEDITVDYLTDASIVNATVIHAIYRQAYSAYENREKYLDGNREIGMIVNEVKMMLQPYKRMIFP